MSGMHYITWQDKVCPEWQDRVCLESIILPLSAHKQRICTYRGLWTLGKPHHRTKFQPTDHKHNNHAYFVNLSCKGAWVNEPGHKEIITWTHTFMHGLPLSLALQPYNDCIQMAMQTEITVTKHLFLQSCQVTLWHQLYNQMPHVCTWMILRMISRMMRLHGDESMITCQMTWAHL